MTLLHALRVCMSSPEEVVDALIALSEQKPGFAYEVGELLQDRQVQKEFPGPIYQGFDLEPAYTIKLVAFDPDRRLDAMKGLRELLHVPIQDVLVDLKLLSDGETVNDPGDSWQGGEWFSQKVIADRIAKWASYGISAIAETPEIPKTHTRTLGQAIGCAANYVH